MLKNFDENKRNSRPRVGITVGDPAGIGAEVTLKAVADKTVLESCLPVIIGDAEFLQKAAALLGLQADYRIVREDTETQSEILINSPDPLIYDCPNIKTEIEFGIESAITGKASAEYIEKAVTLCLEHKIEAIATAPISKNALKMANVPFPGHTEFLAYLTATTEFAMSFFAGNLRVVLLSTHVSLKDALKLVQHQAIANLIRLTDRELKKLGIATPKIAVAALNPHGGENQMFGSEEVAEISPAITECRAEGINVVGPFSADTVFLRNARGEFDVVIAHYHDQATIPVKSLAFGEAVNVTLGLPIIRTSVDHGTAFDIAGKNLAEHSSMKTAIMLAAELSRRKTVYQSKAAI
ncbi:MAG: 4-hydroxythreonine-4-phosphate dehydrogenase PdxA [Pyrinomonadaceae bacterium]